MQGRTHIAVGIATALAVTHPVTMPGILSSVLGGALGGRIVDIDKSRRQGNETDAQKKKKTVNVVIDTVLLVAVLVLDFILGNGICQYILSDLGPRLWISLAALLALLVIGSKTEHRTFTHSVIGMLLFSTAVYFFCKPMAVAFAVGYISHIVADIFNKRGLQLLFPFKQKYSLKLCLADSKPNRILFWIALAVDLVLIVSLVAIALTRTVALT